MDIGDHLKEMSKAAADKRDANRRRMKIGEEARGFDKTLKRLNRTSEQVTQAEADRRGHMEEIRQELGLKVTISQVPPPGE